MDPEQCLVDIRAALDARDYKTAREGLRNYWEWRNRGGFEPKDGDARARAFRAFPAGYAERYL